MNEKNSAGVYKGIKIGLLGMALTAMGAAIAFFFSRAIGVGLVGIGMLIAAAGFIIHLTIFFDRISKKRNH